MLEHDLDLSFSDIAGLTGREETRAFFARLGYPVEMGKETFPDAEGMNQRLCEAVEHIELLARDDAGLLDVYLIEFPSVTVARINDLGTHFKNRGGWALAVLTSDYERIDFVLFDLQQKEGRASSVRAIPRRFTVDRRHPGNQRVVLRVLRRFSWTEPDALAQWDKLRSAFAIGEWSEEFFDNRGLFSDYFLIERMPEVTEAWSADNLKTIRRETGKGLLGARKQFSDKGEAAVREGLLEPILQQLGFEVRPRKDAGDGDITRPDYELWDGETGEKLAVCLAYQWDRFLDGPDPSDKQTESENPGAAVLSLLEQDDNEWAIVTNGKQWRLYTRKTESRATNFFQVDAEEAAADTDPDAFRYFWLLFRAEAFRQQETVVEGETRELNFVEQLLEGSRDYAKQVGDRLKDRVFDDIFPILAEGFVADIRAREGSDADLSQQRLDLIYESTLVLLYRLLFLLYSESRDLLPVREVGGFYEKSLSRIKGEIGSAGGTVESARDEKLAQTYSDAPATSREAPTLYGQLDELFKIIAEGRPSVNVPPYNGGLFVLKPEEALDEREREIAQFLADHALPDLHLAQTIDRLARDIDEKTLGLAMIDYKSLGVRQLGSIYEGLLEFKLRVAPEKMAICKQKGTEVVLPYDEAQETSGVTIQKTGRSADAEELTIPEGAPYLENDKHERKSTGSYYTPDYVVSYIVEHTVGPVLEEKFAAVRQDLDRACQRFHKLDKQRQEADMQRPTGVFDEEKPLIDRIFDIRVMDPAMGSGHFLVSAVDFIADRMIHFLNGFPGNPVERLLAQTRREILKAVEQRGIFIDEQKLTNVNLLKRHVLKRCLYGVDLNPMAVELAKVSLWLHCFTLGAPLSFLDHHLKCGNSLIGEVAAAETVAEQKGQTALGGMSRWDQFARAVQSYMMVSQLADATADQVLTSRKAFQEAEEMLSGPRAECNAVTARHFEGWTNWKVGSAQQAADDPQHPGREMFNAAQSHAQEHSFYHWPLEFPGTWYGIRQGTENVIAPKAEEDAGFDAVIGNPPYDVLPRGTADDWWPAGTNNNLFGHFVVRGGDLVAKGGALGLVVPLSFACGDRFESVRKTIYGRFGRLRASHYSIRPGKAFPAVDQRVTIFCATDRGSSPCELLSSRLHRFQQSEAAQVVQQPDLGRVGPIQQGVIPKTAGDVGAQLYRKLSDMHYRLGQMVADEGPEVAYYHSVARYWITAYDFLPYFTRAGELAISSDTKQLAANDESMVTTYMLLLNSSLFYYWWITECDEFHLLISEIRGFGMPWLKIPAEHSERAQSLVHNLMEAYRRTARRKELRAGGKDIVMDEFFPRRCLEEIRAIDDFVAEEYKLTDAEQTFLRNYDMEFRSDEDE